MHGPQECLGNEIELCAASLHPESPTIYLGFANCLGGQYSHIPERALIKDCALEHGLDFDALNECTSKDEGEFAMGLLRDSAQRTRDAGVTKSCTVCSPWVSLLVDEN